MKFWEIGRIAFLAVTAAAAWFSYLLTSSVQAGLGYPQNGTLLGVWLRFGLLLVVLNVCFCAAYIPERALRRMMWWSSYGRLMVLSVGTLLGAFVALKGGAGIAFYEFSFRAPVGEEQPNQSPEPTRVNARHTDGSHGPRGSF